RSRSAHEHGYPFITHALGRRRDGKTGLQFAGVVVDPGGNTTHPEFQLFVVARIPMAAHQREIAFELVDLGNTVARVTRQPSAHRIGSYLAGLSYRQEQLAGGREMKWGPATDGTNHLHPRALAPGALDVDNFVALLHRQIDGLPCDAVQFTHGLKRDV